MRQPKTLDLTGGWENIVNNVDRHNAILRFESKLLHKKMQKRLAKTVSFAIWAILSVAMGFLGLLSPWISGSAAIGLICSACFLAGRIWEERCG